MSAASNYLEEALLNHVLRNEELTSPTEVYVGIVDDNATEEDLEDGDLTNEITEYDGDRKSVTFTEPTQIEGKATVENNVEVVFENMPEVTINYVIITDDPTKGSGNILYHSVPDDIKTSNQGDTVRFLEGEITVDND